MYVTMAFNVECYTLSEMVNNNYTIRLRSGFIDAVSALADLHYKERLAYLGVSWTGLVISQKGAGSACLVDWAGSRPFRSLSVSFCEHTSLYYILGTHVTDMKCIDLVALIWLFADVVTKLKDGETLASVKGKEFQDRLG